MEETDEPFPQNPNIDKLTLELFMNRNIYKKYVAKNEPEKYEKIVMHHENIRKYKQCILNLTEQLLEDPSVQITTEINEIFDAYSRTLIRHFQQKDMEKANENYRGFQDQDDVLFDPEIMEDRPVEPTPSSSFWGKDRVVKSQTSIAQYDMNMFGIKK
jgi:flagellin-specific chaperone FliS